MERERNKQVFMLLLTLVAGLLSQNLLIPVMSITSVDDQKNYYSRDPNAGSPSTSSHRSPPHGSGGSYGSTPPSHGTPSHRGGGSYGETPPSNCGTPPSGGHYNPTPDPPSGGSSGGGGSYSSPPIYAGGSPSTPFAGTPPFIRSPPVSLIPPITPIIDPGVPTTPTPGISFPSPPFAFDPNSPPFTCNYWRTHPTLIWGVLGFGGTMGSAFGVTSVNIVPGFGSSMSLQQALSNSRSDGFGNLYREGTASFLNSMVDRRFPFTTQQVRHHFAGAIGSNKAAAAQARVFKLANEGRLKLRT